MNIKDLESSGTGLLAFHIVADNESVVVFAPGNKQARHQARKTLGILNVQIRACKRVPWADRYGSERSIPAVDRIEHHIFPKCPWCRAEITSVTSKNIIDGPDIFCDRCCRGSHAIRLKAIAEASTRWFGIEILSVNGIGNARTIVFVFPGCRSYAVWHSEREILTISDVDRTAWERWQRFCRRLISSRNH